MCDKRYREYDDNYVKPYGYKRCSCFTKKYNDDYCYVKEDDFCPKKRDKDYDYEWKYYGYKKCCYLEKSFGRDYDYALKCDGYLRDTMNIKKTNAVMKGMAVRTLK